MPLCCLSPEETKQQNRVIMIPYNNESSNKISTTKYSMITFLPKSILLQFLKPSNYVYLLSAILNFIPFISSMSPIVNLVPFVFILFISVLREGYDDYKRYKNDLKINNNSTKVLVNNTFKTKLWSEVKVGNYVYIKNQESIPGDVILLSSSQENGMAYVETSNLDGNLKTKFCIDNSPLIYPQQYSSLKGRIQIQVPNKNLHDFNGKITFEPNQTKQIRLQNLLMRGTVLKNTHFIVGIVIYSGHDTKVFQNQGVYNNKTSSITRKMHVISIFMSIILLAMCLFVGFLNFRQIKVSELMYLYRGSDNFSNSLQPVASGITSFLLLNMIVPISLNITIQLLKTFQADFYGYDKMMQCQIGQQKQSCKVLNSLIIEELGNVSYILTDKTGTLTSNTMQFKQALINDFIFTTQQKEFQLNQINSPIFQQFWTCVTLCHDAIVDSQQMNYQGPSADEVCFLQFAKSIGYQFKKRTKIHIQLQIQQKKVVFEQLLMLPFTQRKMMSVIVKDLQTMNIFLLTKGADNCILSRKQTNTSQKSQEIMNDFLTRVSKKGFRTLVFGYRLISEEEFKQFIIKHEKYQYNKRNKIINNEELSQNTLYSQIQKNLEIIGATAIEDKLQEGVSQSIYKFRQAGIKIVMITGDKLQTAQNIGHLSDFIDLNSEIFRLRQTQQDIEKWFEDVMASILIINSKFSIVIQGLAISSILTTKNTQTLYNIKKTIQKCDSVIFCRSTPAQKALIVDFFKNTFKKIVLAIGDGGNDVNMIKQADIGIGLIGKQGNEAAFASDFYFGQFKHLQRLIFHHGRWTFQRVAYFFMFFNFKNILVSFILFFYLIYNGYSGRYGLSQLYLGCFNTFFGVIPTMYVGIFEQDVNGDKFYCVKNKLPLLYKQCKQQNLFSYKKYLYWFILSVFCACWLFFPTLLVLDSTTATNQYGSVSDWISLSTNLQLASSLITIGVLTIDIQTYNWWTFFCIGGGAYAAGIFVFILQNYAFIQTFSDCYFGFSDNFNFRFWCLTVVLVFGILIPKIVIKSLQYQYFPSLSNDLKIHQTSLQKQVLDQSAQELSLIPKLI